jgi:hypothetical protein
MDSPTTRYNLWMDVHRLASALEEVGLNREERIDTAVKVFMDLPPTVRRQLRTDLRMVAVDLFDMLPLIASAENEIESQKRDAGRTG